MRSALFTRLRLFLLGSLLGMITLLLVLVTWYVRTLSHASGLSVQDMRSLYTSSQETMLPDQMTIVLLGLDQRDDSLESTQLTDAIIIAQVDIRSSRIVLTPIPRDLWIDELKTKINALYFYGEERENTSGIDYTMNELERITDISIDHYLVLDYNDMDELIDTLGGVTVDIPASFIDTSFPNPDHLSDPTEPIYETVRFEQGTEHMDGDRALTYIRSRSSDDVAEGSDLARSSRQLQVFDAMIARFTNKAFIVSPVRMGLVYRFWDTHVDTSLTTTEMLSIARSLEIRNISFESRTIPASFHTDDQLLYNPPIDSNGLWVWAPRDPSWDELRAFFTK